MLRRAIVLTAGTALFSAALVATPAQAADPAYRVLVFSKTAGFRHDSIPQGITAIQQLGAANNFTVTATEDANQFTTANLAQFQAVVFLNTTGDVLNGTQQTAFESYIDGGGGYVGVHSAADTEYDWPFYGKLVGAYFDSHPAIQQATVRIEDRAHAATAHLGQTWTRTDEWYNYRTNPRNSAKVLPNLDESTYSGGTMAATTRSPGATARAPAGRSTPGSATPRRRTPTRPSAPCCSAASATRPVGPSTTAGPRPGTRPSTTARPPAGRWPDRAA